MKILLISLFTLFWGLPFQNDNSDLQKNEQMKPQLKVYYFHGDRRCVTCKSIEANTKKTLNTYFSEEMKSGVIQFMVVNIDREENKEIAKEFNVYSSSLFLVKKTNTSEEKINLTNFAFSYGRNEAKFMAEFKKKIDEQLN